MLARLWDAQVPIAWVVADTVYGGNLDLRNWLETDQYLPLLHLRFPLALTVPEVRHLLAQLIWPSSSSACRVLAWSWWRRRHQSHASYYHTKCRLKAG